MNFRKKEIKIKSQFTENTTQNKKFNKYFNQFANIMSEGVGILNEKKILFSNKSLRDQFDSKEENLFKILEKIPVKITQKVPLKESKRLSNTETNNNDDFKGYISVDSNSVFFGTLYSIVEDSPNDKNKKKLPFGKEKRVKDP